MKKYILKIKTIFYKMLFKINFLNNRDKYYELYEESKLWYKKARRSREEELIDHNASYIANVVIPASVSHKEVFGKYKNINIGKEVVLLGSGPTLSKYEPIEGAVHIGVNTVFKFEKIKLDYLFLQDYLVNEKEQHAIDSYIGNDCKKFYGIHQLSCWEKYTRPIPESSLIKSNAERYYFKDLPINHEPIWGFTPDISVKPLTAYSSVIFPAFQFALWTYPKKIYIVGCDCSAKFEHFSKIEGVDFNKNFPSMDNILFGWQKAKLFAERFYPDVEIVSINPVGLKDLFLNLPAV